MRPASLACLLLFSSACLSNANNALDDGGTSDDAADPTALPPNPGAAPLRRLTNSEYDNTVADLLGDTTGPASAFPGATTSTQGYDTYASGLGVSATHAQAFLTAAETLAKNAVADLPTLMGCDPSGAAEAACVSSFLASFGERAFRRPLASDELARFTTFETSARMTQPLADAIGVTVEAFLLSPAFLYRVEYGQPGKAGELVKLTSWEMASRLSYTFLGSMPDQELFRAARADELIDAANVEKQARRLVQSTRAKAVFTSFADQWLELRAIETMQKNGASFPGYADTLRPLLKEETNRLVDSVVWDGDGDIHKLFSADYTFMNGTLAAFYGKTGVTGDAWVKVDLDPAQRRGILTTAGVLASHGKPNENSPPRRGKFISTKLFCMPVGDPPPNAIAMAPQRTAGETVRQFFTKVEQQGACGGCHQSLDGLGFGLEAYDSVGLWRTTELGQMVDSSGSVLGTDVDGAYNGGVQLADKISQSQIATECVARQLFRFATARPDTPDDMHSLAVLIDRWKTAKYDVRELLVALTQTDAFLLKASVGVGQ